MIILLLLSGITIELSAQGDLLLSPVRIVFEGSKQKEEINLVNTGTDTATYSVSFLQYNMTEDGNFVIIEKADSGQMFADPYLRIFPRQVTLAPREAQIVRVQFRRKPDMAPGEYRSHLYFRSEKDIKPLGTKPSVNDSTLMSVQITPVFGISIPIIIRTGEVKVTSSLSDLRLDIQQDTITMMKFTINRSGNISVYGDILIEYSPPQGKPVEIGRVRGIAVYTCTNKRNVSVRLSNVKLTNLKTGKIIVRFTSSGDSPYELYSEKELILQ
jgi:P pilus assembly chaperone PapD